MTDPAAGEAREVWPDDPGRTRSSRRLRVAFVLGSATGGMAAHVTALAAGCREAGLAVHVFGPPSAAGSLGPEIPVTPIEITGRPKPLGDVVAIARLRTALRAWPPDVVHAHGVRAGAFAALALLDWVRLPTPAFVVTIHNAPPDGRLARLGYGLLERVCARRADLVLGASPDLVERMRARGAADVARFDVAAPAVDAPPSAAQVARARADIGAAGRPVVLAVGRLAPQKRLDVLVEAAARWQHRQPRPLTVIAGDGPLAGDLRSQAARVGADVLLLGQRTDVPALLAAADVVVVPSQWEARALIVQEALRAGRPLVATSTGGIPELTGEDAAVLIPVGDPTALAAAVCAVLDDPGLAGRLALAARARSAELPTESESVTAALAIYARLAASRIVS
ncbi:MAG TPA: glycosyltransferase family 4 protein [Streptosporangiaceae bacterium]|jgi:glycosyltransferase involved in cell wall biosynthesis